MTNNENNNINANAKLQQALDQFYGSESFYRHALFRKYRYTEGVQYLAQEGQAYWLLDYIFGKQFDEKKLKQQPFQVWTITVEEDKSAIIEVSDGNKNRLARFELDFTTFPISPFSLWLIEGTLLLPSEY